MLRASWFLRCVCLSVFRLRSMFHLLWLLLCVRSFAVLLFRVFCLSRVCCSWFNGELVQYVLSLCLFHCRSCFGHSVCLPLHVLVHSVCCWFLRCVRFLFVLFWSALRWWFYSLLLRTFQMNFVLGPDLVEYCRCQESQMVYECLIILHVN